MESALLSYEELNTLLSQNAENLILLDATFVLPGTPIDPQLIYQNKRIGNARYFDVDYIADLSSSLPHMLPGADVFAEKVAELGVSNDSKVVIYGQTGLALGPARAWWMFRIFGHENVYILNGGLMDWEEKGFPVTLGLPDELPKGKFNSQFDSSRVIDLNGVAGICKNCSSPILDARPAERFSGEAAEPRPGMRSGHIPNSRNIPTGSLIDGKTGGLRAKEELKTIIPEDILEAEQPAVMTCGSGVTACVIALACYELGRDDWRIYDGSWTEWGQSDQPIAVANN